MADDDKTSGRRLSVVFGKRVSSARGEIFSPPNISSNISSSSPTSSKEDDDEDHSRDQSQFQHEQNSPEEIRKGSSPGPLIGSHRQRILSSSGGTEKLEDLSIEGPSATASEVSAKYVVQPEDNLLLSGVPLHNHSTLSSKMPYSEFTMIPSPSVIAQSNTIDSGAVYKWANLAPVMTEPWESMLSLLDCSSVSKSKSGRTKRRPWPAGLRSLLRPSGRAFNHHSRSSPPSSLSHSSQNRLFISRHSSNNVNWDEFKRKSHWTKDVLNNLSEAPVSLDAISSVSSGKEDDFFSVGLRYLLPLSRHNVDAVVNLLIDINESYFDVPYHHQGHAALVLHACIHLLKLSGVLPILSSEEKMAVYVACLGHDIGHPGKNAEFLASLDHPLHRLYNGKSALENYHAAATLKLLDDPQNNIFGHLNRSNYTAMKQLIIEVILATDLSQHHRYLKDADTRLRIATKQIKGPANLLDDIEIRTDVLKLCVKTADVAYMALDTPVEMLQWAIDYYEELVGQNAIERELGLDTSSSWVENMGTPTWFDQNAKFAEHFIMPMGYYLAEIEYKTRQKNISNFSSETSSKSCQTFSSSIRGNDEEAGEKKSVSSSSFGMLDRFKFTAPDAVVLLIKTLRGHDLELLAKDLAEYEVRENQQEQFLLANISRPDSASNVSKSYYSGGVSVGGMSKWFAKAKNTMSPFLPDKPPKLRKNTAIWKFFLEPLERNVQLLRMTTTGSNNQKTTAIRDPSTEN